LSNAGHVVMGVGRSVGFVIMLVGGVQRVSRAKRYGDMQGVVLVIMSMR
jgi:hypothetical protein